MVAGVDKRVLTNVLHGVERAPNSIVETSTCSVVTREEEEHKYQGCGCCVASSENSVEISRKRCRSAAISGLIRLSGLY